MSWICALALSSLLVSGPKPEVVTPQPPQIVVDSSQMALLVEYGQKAEKLANEWYPKINAILGVEKPASTEKITIRMDVNYDGPAAASGAGIVVGARHVVKNPNDLGMIVHELTHVVQGYPKYDPVWLVEGIADYVRFFHYEPQTQVRPNPKTADVHQSYRTTAHFLNWAQKKYNPDLVKKLNAALKAGTYTEPLFKDLTGKTLEELNAEWKTTLI